MKLLQPGFLKENYKQLKVLPIGPREAGFIDKVEVLTFVDGGLSIEWMIETGAKVQNLLNKGSLNHLTHQLKKTPEQHFKEIPKILVLRLKKGLKPMFI